MPEFDAKVLDILLGEYYVTWSAILENCKLGQVAMRDRRYTWLLHRRLLDTNMRVERFQWDSKFVAHFERICGIACDVLMEVSSDLEVQRELEWASTRPTSRGCSRAAAPSTAQENGASNLVSFKKCGFFRFDGSGVLGVALRAFLFRFYFFEFSKENLY